MLINLLYHLPTYHLPISKFILTYYNLLTYQPTYAKLQPIT
jgi:hypothetical protein